MLYGQVKPEIIVVYHLIKMSLNEIISEPKAIVLIYIYLSLHISVLNHKLMKGKSMM